MSNINHEEEVKKLYPNATAKHWSYDNGHGVTSFWSISKDNVCVSYTSDRYISGQRATKKNAWADAYQKVCLPQPE